MSTKEPPSHKRSHVAQYNTVHIYHAFVTLMFRWLFPQLEREFGRNGARCVNKKHNVPPVSSIWKLELLLWMSKCTCHLYPYCPPIETIKADYWHLSSLRRDLCSRQPYGVWWSKVVLMSRMNPEVSLVLSEASFFRNQLAGVKVRSQSGDRHQISASLIVGLRLHSASIFLILTIPLLLFRLYWPYFWGDRIGCRTCHPLLMVQSPLQDPPNHCRSET